MCHVITQDSVDPKCARYFAFQWFLPPLQTWKTTRFRALHAPAPPSVGACSMLCTLCAYTALTVHDTHISWRWGHCCCLVFPMGFMGYFNFHLFPFILAHFHLFHPFLSFVGGNCITVMGYYMTTKIFRQ